MEEVTKKFQTQYFSPGGGKFRLTKQAKFLGELADNYQQLYLKRGIWTDCLKAHALYNSCAARDGGNDTWLEKIFKLRQSYWKGNEKLTYNQQCDITTQLTAMLHSIRNDYREKIAIPRELALKFPSNPEDVPGSAIVIEFVDSVKEISIKCTEQMMKLASRIISESVGSLVHEPPCHFAVLAFGSLARGEATPYSDLEYLFLIETKNASTLDYFRRLAVTSYFLIGNLRETKLSYMDIKELNGWFDDRSKNGFKIDGLSRGAGNIPTGNGSTKENDCLILTSNELLQQYKNILDNPKVDSLRGDFTAMLTYLKLIYSSGPGVEWLSSLKLEMSAMNISSSRSKANDEMFHSDMMKFDYRPDSRVHGLGYTIDVKKQLYRFPSILLLDLAIIFDCAGDDSWRTIEILLDSEKISESMKFTLSLILACACFIRLSAYLYHDSQDDRISVAERCSDFSSSNAERGPQRRWFVPHGLFIILCQYMVPLKQQLVERFKEKKTVLRGSLERGQAIWVHKMRALICCGKDAEALHILKRELGEDILQNLQKQRNIALRYPKYLPDIAEIFFTSNIASHYELALSLYKQLIKIQHQVNQTDGTYNDNNQEHIVPSEVPSKEYAMRIVECLVHLNRLGDAFKTLKQIKVLDTADDYLCLARYHLAKEDWVAAEEESNISADLGIQ